MYHVRSSELRCHERAPGFAPIHVNWAFLDTFPECLRAGFVVGK